MMTLAMAAAALLASATTSYWQVGTDGNMCLASQLDFPGGKPPPDVVWGMTRQKNGWLDLRVPLTKDHPLSHPYTLALAQRVRLVGPDGRKVADYRVSSRDAFPDDPDRFALVLAPRLPAEDEAAARKVGGEARVRAMAATNRTDFIRDLGKATRLDLLSISITDAETLWTGDLRGTADAVTHLDSCFESLQSGSEYRDYFRIE
jgi:hypothetical protein